MMENYEYYRCFYYVGKYRNLTKAAEAMLSSQPNVTRTMNALERALGCRLLVRSNRGVVLTPEGERLYEHVAVAQRELEEGEAEVMASRELRSGVVTVGASEMALHGLLMPVLRQFRKDYPDIRLRISNHSTPQAITAVKDKTVDFAVVTTPTGVKPPLRETRLISLQEILIAGPRYAELSRHVMDFTQLSDYPLVALGYETKSYEFYQHIFARHGLTFTPDIEAATTDQILPLVCNDMGLGFLPSRFAEAALKRGEIYQIPLAEPVPRRFICLITDEKRPLSQAARKLQQRLCDYSEEDR